MSKTKEIDVWVPEYTDETLCEDIALKPQDDGVQWLKAKLIIELPEKKITMTESQFEDMCFYIENNCYIKKDESVHYHALKYIEKELGF